MMPAACARASPSASWQATSSTLRAGSGYSVRTRWRSVPPSTSSMTVKGSPAVSPISWIVTMFGWLRDEAARASWAKRPRRSGIAAKGSGRNLTATSRWRSWSRAR